MGNGHRGHYQRWRRRDTIVCIFVSLCVALTFLFILAGANFGLNIAHLSEETEETDTPPSPPPPPPPPPPSSSVPVSECEWCVDPIGEPRFLSQCSWRTVSSSDFALGPLILNDGDCVRLSEDIIFDPKRDGLQRPFDRSLRNLPSFTLGTFAAVIIIGDNVAFDMNHHSLNMSREMFFDQPFFAHISIGSSPFPLGEGPVDFDRGFAPKTGTGVVIQNGRLGEGTHFGILGNFESAGPEAASNVLIRNMQISDFTVAGIHLNAAKSVCIRNSEVGPSMQTTPFGAVQSQMTFLRNIVYPVLNATLGIAPVAPNAMCADAACVGVWRNNLDVAMREVELELEAAREAFLAAPGDGMDSMPSALSSVRGMTPERFLPDGSRTSGIVLHNIGSAVGEIPRTCDLSDPSSEPLSDIFIADVVVTGITGAQRHFVGLDKDTPLGPRTVRGPVGDLIPINIVADGQAVASMSSDMTLFKAQSALAYLGMASGMHDPDHGYAHPMFGTLYFPGELVLDEIPYGAQNGTRVCSVDAMKHNAQGVAGIVIDGAARVAMINTRITRIENKASPIPVGNRVFANAEDGEKCYREGSMATHQNLGGVELATAAYGIRIYSSKHVAFEGEVSSIDSDSGDAFGIVNFDSRSGIMAGGSVRDVSARSGRAFGVASMNGNGDWSDLLVSESLQITGVEGVHGNTFRNVLFDPVECVHGVPVSNHFGA